MTNEQTLKVVVGVNIAAYASFEVPANTPAEAVIALAKAKFEARSLCFDPDWDSSEEPRIVCAYGPDGTLIEAQPL